VSHSPTTTDIAKPGNILGDLPPELAANNIVAIDYLGYAAQLIFRKLTGLGHLLNSGLFENLTRGVPANTANMSQGNPNRFAVGSINTNYTRHLPSSPSKLSMSRPASH
jgi:hypothetical protein